MKNLCHQKASDHQEGKQKSSWKRKHFNQIIFSLLIMEVFLPMVAVAVRRKSLLIEPNDSIARLISADWLCATGIKLYSSPQSEELSIKSLNRCSKDQTASCGWMSQNASYHVSHPCRKTHFRCQKLVSAENQLKLLRRVKSEEEKNRWYWAAQVLTIRRCDVIYIKLCGGLKCFNQKSSRRFSADNLSLWNFQTTLTDVTRSTLYYRFCLSRRRSANKFIHDLQRMIATLRICPSLIPKMFSFPSFFY